MFALYISKIEMHNRGADFLLSSSKDYFPGCISYETFSYSNIEPTKPQQRMVVFILIPL